MSLHTLHPSTHDEVHFGFEQETGVFFTWLQDGEPIEDKEQFFGSMPTGFTPADLLAELEELQELGLTDEGDADFCISLLRAGLAHQL